MKALKKTLERFALWSTLLLSLAAMTVGVLTARARTENAISGAKYAVFDKSSLRTLFSAWQNE